MPTYSRAAYALLAMALGLSIVAPAAAAQLRPTTRPAAATRPVAASAAGARPALNAPDVAIDPPATFKGERLDDLGGVLTLNLRDRGGGVADTPQVVADIGPERLKDLHLREIASGGGWKYPLRDAIKASRAAAGAKFRVLINAPGDLPYGQLQFVLQECAAADVTDIGFVTKPVAAAADKGAPQRWIQPCTTKLRDKIPEGPSGILVVYVASTKPDADGKVSLNARVRDGTATDADTLAALLGLLRMQHLASGGKPDELDIVLSPTRATRYAEVMAAFEAARAAEWPKVGFVVATR